MQKKQMTLEFTYFGKSLKKLSRKELLEVIEMISEDSKRYFREKEIMGDEYYELLAKKTLATEEKNENT